MSSVSSVSATLQALGLPGVGDVREYRFHGRDYYPGKGTFKTNEDGLERLARADRIWPTAANTMRYVRFFDDFAAIPIANVWMDTGTGSFTEDKLYVVQTNVKVVERCIQMTTDPGDLVLDPTCGSGTAAYIAEKWGRRWITIDTSRVALALARSRVMGARYPYYLLADSTAGREKEAGTNADGGLGSPDRWRYPAGLCVSTRTAHHPEVNCQQRRNRSDLGAVAGDPGAPPGGAKRCAWPCVGGVGGPAGGRRAVARAGNDSVETVAVSPVPMRR